VPTRFITDLNAGQHRTLLTYGTSLTEGGQWVRDLAAWLDASYPGQATVINSGMSGKASGTALAHLDERVIAHRPHLILLEFAVNDAAPFTEGDPDWNISPEKSRANLHLLLDRILAALPQTEIILQTMNSAWDAPNGNRSASRRPRLPEYYEGYRQIARERGLPLIDHYPHWLNLQTTNLSLFQHYLEDGIHPTPEGSTAVTFPAVLQALVG